MAVKGLTVGELAKRVRRPDEDITALIVKLRNWTRDGLLQPYPSQQHPGTGRSRRYSEKSIATARALSVLADVVGVPAVMSRSLNFFLANAVDLFEGPPAEPTYLVIGRPIDGLGGEVAIYKENTLFYGLRDSPFPAHIVIDIKKYFQQLNINPEERP